MTSPLLLIGASVRAAAQSAHRGGFEPYAIDLFGDRDLQQIAKYRVAADYPADIPELAREFPDAPFLYTGALENSHVTLEQLCRDRTLLGNDPAIVRRVRDPFRLQSILKESGFPSIPVQRHNDPPADAAGWLVKPLLSGHGFGIDFASGGPAGASHYFQRLLPGEPVGAAFLADGGESRLIGTHRQLTGLSVGGSSPFQFCGAVAPASLAPETVRIITEIGAALTRIAGLRGLFGCDFIVNSEGPFLLEVNPRYTSAMELWEHLLDRSLAGDHVRACRDGVLPPAPRSPRAGEVLKLILYAPEQTIVPTGLETCVQELRNCRLADLPEAGATIDRGRPVCTLLAWSASHAEPASDVETAIQSVGRACGWSGRHAEFLYHEVSARIAAEFT